MALVQFHQTGVTISCSYLAPIVVPEDGEVHVAPEVLEVLQRELNGYFDIIDETAELVQQLDEQIHASPEAVTPAATIDEPTEQLNGDGENE